MNNNKQETLNSFKENVEKVKKTVNNLIDAGNKLKDEVIKRDKIIILKNAEIDCLKYQVDDLLKTIENIKNGSLN